MLSVALASVAFADPHRDFYDLKKQMENMPDDPNMRVRFTQLALATGNYKEAEEGLQWIRKMNVPDWGEWATQQTKYLPVLGKKAPDFQGKDLDGWTVKLADYEKRVVLIHFWSAVDGVSPASLPQLKDMIQKYKNSPAFTILGVSLDKDPAVVKQTVGVQKLTWPQMFEGVGHDSPTAKIFQIQATPSLALIDSDGTLRYVGPFGQMLNETIDVAVGQTEDRKKAATTNAKLTPRSKDNKAFCVEPIEIFSPQSPTKVLTKLKPGACLTLGKLDPASGMTAVSYDDPETGRMADGLVQIPGESPK